jgi:hypothetical protein
LVEPKEKTVKVFEPNKAVVTFTRDMMLVDGTVLPGFTLELKRLFKVI